MRVCDTKTHLNTSEDFEKKIIPKVFLQFGVRGVIGPDVQELVAEAQDKELEYALVDHPENVLVVEMLHLKLEIVTQTLVLVRKALIIACFRVVLFQLCR